MNRGGLRFAAVGLVAVVAVGCGSPRGSIAVVPVAPQTTESKNGPFVIALTTDSVARAGAPVSARATANYDGVPREVEAFMPGSGPLRFSLSQIGGDIRVDGGGPADCVSKTITRGTIADSPFVKSGGYDPAGPHAQFYRAFFAEDALILPAGEWQIVATLDISLDGCSEAADTAKASSNVIVLP
jgi:hypothetical protein